MQIILKHIILRLSVLLFITTVFISFEQLTSYSIADFVFSEDISFVDSEQMEEEVETENELNSKRKSEGFDFIVELPLIISVYDARNLIVNSFFFPEDISPPPELV